MSSLRPPVPTQRHDQHRLVTGAKIATVAASALGFGAVAIMVVSNPVGVTASSGAGAGTQSAPRALPGSTSTDDFFAVPPGFVQPPLGGGGSGGASGGSGGFRQQGGSGGFGQGGGQSGSGGNLPGMGSGGS